MQTGRLKALQRSYQVQGIEARLHGNLNKLPIHGFTTEEICRVTMFLDNYAETHAILLPGRIPGYKNWDVKLLPTQMTKNSVWLEYVHAHATFTVRIVSYRSFCRLWQRYRPSLIITKPKSDLCWECQQNSATITASFNKSEEEKIMVIMVFKIDSKLKIKIHHNKYYNTFIDPDKSNRPYQQSTNRKKPLQSSM